MYSYVTAELPALVDASFPADASARASSATRWAATARSICALKNPDRYRSLSAFAPICAPMRCPWGEKAFSGYLGADRAGLARLRRERARRRDRAGGARSWSTRAPPTISSSEQLKPELLQEACAAAGIPLTLRYQAGYDHSYYFMASFIGRPPRPPRAAAEGIGSAGLPPLSALS